MTTVYLIRHSKTFKFNNIQNTDNLQVQNEKYSLSSEGENIARNKFNSSEFDNIDVLYSSKYVRSIQTANLLAEKNNLKINIISDFGERKFGVSSWDELPEQFEIKQFYDENYKIGDGENQKEVRERMYLALTKLLNENNNKRIAIVSHATAMTYLLMKWCDVEVVDDKLKFIFKDRIIFDKKFDYCETFKLVFDDNNKIIDINRF